MPRKPRFSQAAIALDPDAPEWSDADFAEARPAIDVVPRLVRRRGKQKTATKELIPVRIDRVLERLRAGGTGWQSRISETLRRARGIDAA